MAPAPNPGTGGAMVRRLWWIYRRGPEHLEGFHRSAISVRGDIAA